MRLWIAAAAGVVLAGCQQVETTDEVNVDPPEVTDGSTQELTIFTGGTIYTGNGLETVEAVTVDESGRIIAVSPETSKDWDESEVTLVDLGGAPIQRPSR